MPYVVIVTVLALIQATYFGLMVGRARARYGVHAPATTGHDIFERTFRVQMNTNEQLLVFLPLLWIYAYFVSPLWAAGLGVVYLIGRVIYSVTYVKDPKSRSIGFLLTVLPSFTMMIWLLAWAANAIIKGAA